jgi:hypothetical protein
MVGLEVIVEQNKYMLLSRHHNVGQNHDIKIANRCFENVAQFKYLGTTVTNQNLIHEEIKRRMNSGNVCYHSVQYLLSSLLLFKNIRIRKYKIIILPVVLYGCETCSLTWREDTDWGRLRVGCSEEYLGWRDMKWREVRENCIMRSFIICTLRQI